MCSGKKTQLKKTSARPEGRRPRGRRLHIQTGEISALSERRWQESEGHGSAERGAGFAGGYASVVSQKRSGAVHAAASQVSV